ncbi:uncharacterized protein LOC134822970 [Bolinopsis microptera]|uniref:uncharacterized protein LOC134822970 n=1 Tax=Bolinopsis microptera TaxID=2820187 RepID=UPI00307A1011
MSNFVVVNWGQEGKKSTGVSIVNKEDLQSRAAVGQMVQVKYNTKTFPARVIAFAADEAIAEVRLREYCAKGPDNNISIQNKVQKRKAIPAAEDPDVITCGKSKKTKAPTTKAFPEEKTPAKKVVQKRKAIPAEKVKVQKRKAIPAAEDPDVMTCGKRKKTKAPTTKAFPENELPSHIAEMALDIEDEHRQKQPTTPQPTRPVLAVPNDKRRSST